jgi:spore coat protein A, manganese oxidase
LAPVIGPTTRSVQDGSIEEVLTLGPAERADVLLDLSGFTPGEKVDLIDIIPFSQPVPVMRFAIEAGPPAPPAAALSPFPRSTRLPKPAPPATAPGHATASAIPRRVIGLLPKVLSPTTTMLTINDRAFHDTVEEQPALDTEEIWEFLNITGEEHPMHLHLVNFEVLDRRGFEVVDPDPNTYTERAASYFRAWLAMPPVARPPLPQGLAFNNEVIPRDANEIAPKDTVRVPPFTLTRIHVAFKFRTGMYMYHCHILEHEDMEMMRPLLVVLKGMHAGPGHGHENGHTHGHGH